MSKMQYLCWRCIYLCRRCVIYVKDTIICWRCLYLCRRCVIHVKDTMIYVEDAYVYVEDAWFMSKMQWSTSKMHLFTRKKRLRDSTPRVVIVIEWNCRARSPSAKCTPCGERVWENCRARSPLTKTQFYLTKLQFWFQRCLICVEVAIYVYQKCTEQTKSNVYDEGWSVCDCAV